jgi:flavin reductase (DIM6/NTAB) family NADH-FMN oxidoreductase RutF
MACRVVAAHEAGDHTIYVGQVESGTVDESRKPLAYCRAGLGSFSPV